jgi:hypothetical protein
MGYNEWILVRVNEYISVRLGNNLKWYEIFEMRYRLIYLVFDLIYNIDWFDGIYVFINMFVWVCY